MRIRPRLFDWDNLTGPQWIQPELSQSEYEDLSEATVMFIGQVPAEPNRAVVLGSGFIVGVADTLIVATASHIFTEWVERMLPSAPHALKGLVGDRDDVMRRLHAVILDRRIVACVNPMRTLTAMMVPIVGLAINSNPRDLDGGFVQLGLPPHADRDSFRTLPIDADLFSFQDPVLMAGYVGGGREYSIGEQPWVEGFYEQKMAVRAGRVAELVEEPDGHRSPMYRVLIPSRPGMSGGPLIAIRPSESEVFSFATAVGIVSSSRLSSPILINHCEEGETWVSPWACALGRRVSINGTPTMMADAIHNGTIRSYGVRAGSFEYIRDESNGVARTTFRKRDDSPDGG